MKALTVRQPWATLLCDPSLPKWIETRSRRTHVRGTIGIIAAKWAPGDCVLDVGDYEMVAGWYTDAPRMVHWTLTDGTADVCDLLLGFLIGTVDLYDCIPILSDSYHNDHHIALSDVLIHAVKSAEGWALLDVNDQAPYGDFTPGRWAWLTRNARLLDGPIPMRGAQHWQEVDL